MLLALWLIAPAPGHASAGEGNLLLNASVEDEDPNTPGKPLAWRADAYLDAVATFEWTAQAADGSHALRVEVSSAGDGDAKWWSSPVPVPADTRLFLVRDTFRASAASTLMIRAVGADESQYQWLPVVSAPPASEWTLAENVVEVPDWTQTLSVAHVLPTGGWLETDSYVLEAVDPDKPPILGPRPLVSIAFDDGWTSSYIHALPVMEELGIRGTHFIITDWVDKPGYSDHLNSKKLRHLAELGHEIGSHSLDHEPLTTLPPDRIIEEVIESREKLESFGFPVRGFVPPEGQIPPEQEGLIQEHYDYMRRVEAGLNYEPYVTYNLRTVVVTDTMDQGAIQAWIRDAAADEAWLILLYHRFDEDAQSESFVTPASFRATMEYLVDNGADIRPVGEVLGVWSPDDYVPPANEPTEKKSFDQPDFGDSTGCATSATPHPSSSAPALALLLLAALLLTARRGRLKGERH